MKLYLNVTLAIG